MNTDQNTLASLKNQAFALMARLHVIIRRQTGRVIDIEYMRIDPVYCRYVLNMAVDMQNDDLPPLCEKLQEVYFGLEWKGSSFAHRPSSPLISKLGGAPVITAEAGIPAKAEPNSSSDEKEASERHHNELNDAVEKGYIGRLR